ncbi:hypothetical protein [Granulicella arctica]|uniref:hypothetical protein n=1 Tax=Granulicella arctica TaxID=940613 RepID=UPI0021DFE0A2|nr:hypothetical protein [Granulicella arctica]
MNPAIQRILDTEWPATKQHLSASTETLDVTHHVFWDVRLTPGLPTAWPPNGALIYYAYAAGRHPALLIDGERITAPWATFNLVGNYLTFRRLGDNPQTIGTQGVRPLSPDEITLATQQEPVAAPTHLDHARPYYRLWSNTNGIIAQHLRPGLPEFFQWIDTDPTRS